MSDSPLSSSDQEPLSDFQRARAAWESGELAIALTLVERILQQHPDDFDSLNLLGILQALHYQFDAARMAWSRALALVPNDVNVLSNLGHAEFKSGNLDLAVEHLETATRLDPHHANSWLNLSVIRDAQGRSDEALAALHRVLEAQPDHLQATFNIATLHQQRFDYDVAHEWYKRVLAIEPNHVEARTNLMFGQYYLVPPSPELIADEARVLAAQIATLAPACTDWPVAPDPDKRLRIGLVSADLRNHPVGYFIEALLVAQAARDFDWVVYANTPYVSVQTQRLQQHAPNWRTVYTWSDEALAAQIRHDRVDVLIDLSGCSAGHRLRTFARRPAPLQVTWLGYFGTTGLSTMDAVIADPHCVPVGEEAWFSERVWRMPHTRFAFAPPQEAPPVGPLPALARGHITFGCFQELAKVNDAVLRAWGHIAQAVPTAHWRLQTQRLKEGREDRAKLLARMTAAGMDVSRVSLHGSMPRADYLAAHAEVDVLLDTFCYPGGTTTTEALWMGVPTLTLATPGMLGRQGQGLMNAAQMAPFWVCQTVNEYVERAVALAQPKYWAELATLRAGLREHVAQTALFDGERFARDWVDLVRAMWRDACQRGWPVSADAALPASASATPSPAK